MSGTSQQQSRGKVYLVRGFGSEFGLEFGKGSQWAYLTPRFPAGLATSDLSKSTAPLQSETLVVWFLRNFIPATGPVFGFAVAPGGEPLLVSGGDGRLLLDASTPGSSSGRQGEQPQTVGFGAPFLDGGPSLGLLQAEFGACVSAPVIEQVASVFDGVWRRLPSEQLHDFDKMSSEELRDTLLGHLTDIRVLIEKLPTHEARSGIGDNSSDILTPEVKLRLLTATDDARLSLLSEDYSRLCAAWETISGFVYRQLPYVNALVHTFLTSAFKTGGGAIGVVGVVSLALYAGVELDLWSKAQAIDAALKALSGGLK